MGTITLIVEILALTTFVLSYQMNKRKNIILVNGCSSILYVLCYALKGSFDGATLDILSTVSAFVANNKHKKFIAKNTALIIILINLIMLVSGLVAYEDLFTFCAVLGAILQTSALWISDEKKIRIVSFIGALFWLAYNLSVPAYGLAIGSFLSIVSIGTAILRYDILPKKYNN